MEIHGFTEHGSIDATIDGLRMTVPDDMANRHRQMIADWEALGNTIPAYEPPAPEPGNYRLYKIDLIERLSNEEAEAFEGRLNSFELVKLRLAFNAADYFESDHFMFAVLHWEMALEFGEQRADELLAQQA